MNESFIRLAGWSAYVNAVAFITSIIAVVIYFSVGGFWGSLSDTASVIWALSFMPLAWLLYQMHRSVNQPVALLAVLIGLIAMATFAIFQILLILRVLRFEQVEAPVLIASGAIGLCLLMNGLLARSAQTLPTSLVWVMIVLGLGNMLGAVGFLLGGYEHPLAAVGLLVGVIAGPVWAIWLGRLLFNSPVQLVLNTSK